MSVLRVRYPHEIFLSTNPTHQPRRPGSPLHFNTVSYIVDDGTRRASGLGIEREENEVPLHLGRNYLLMRSEVSTSLATYTYGLYSLSWPAFTLRQVTDSPLPDAVNTKVKRIRKSVRHQGASNNVHILLPTLPPCGAVRQGYRVCRAVFLLRKVDGRGHG